MNAAKPPSRKNSVRILPTKLASPAADARLGPPIIGAGLALLLAFFFWPAAPVATGMSLIMLGATLATVARHESGSRSRALIAFHLLTYASLYAIFVGAILDATRRTPAGVLSLAARVDLTASALFFAVAIYLGIACVWRGQSLSSR
jgi:hypothetical protein